MIAQLGYFKFNSTNARILLLYPYVVNITLWVGLTERTNHHHFDDAPIGGGELRNDL